MQTLEIDVPTDGCDHNRHTGCEEVDAKNPSSQLVTLRQLCLRCRGGRIIRFRADR